MRLRRRIEKLEPAHGHPPEELLAIFDCSGHAATFAGRNDIRTTRPPDSRLENLTQPHEKAVARYRGCLTRARSRRPHPPGPGNAWPRFSCNNQSLSSRATGTIERELHLHFVGVAVCCKTSHAVSDRLGRGNSKTLGSRMGTPHRFNDPLDVAVQKKRQVVNRCMLSALRKKILTADAYATADPSDAATLGILGDARMELGSTGKRATRTNAWFVSGPISSAITGWPIIAS